MAGFTLIKFTPASFNFFKTCVNPFKEKILSYRFPFNQAIGINHLKNKLSYNILFFQA